MYLIGYLYYTLDRYVFIVYTVNSSFIEVNPFGGMENVAQQVCGLEVQMWLLRGSEVQFGCQVLYLLWERDSIEIHFQA